MTVKDPTGLRTLQVINAFRSTINRNPDQKQKNCGFGNRYCTENHELHYQTRFWTWGFQMTNRTSYRCIQRKKEKKKIKIPVVVLQ